MANKIPEQNRVNSYEMQMAAFRQAAPQGRQSLTRKQNKGFTKGSLRGYEDFYGNTPDELRAIAENIKNTQGVQTGTEMQAAKQEAIDNGTLPAKPKKKTKTVMNSSSGPSSKTVLGSTGAAPGGSKAKLGV